MRRRQETAVSVCEAKSVLFRPNLPIRHIQMVIPGTPIKPDVQIDTALHVSLYTSYKATDSACLNKL
jgi:hypothetical protein